MARKGITFEQVSAVAEYLINKNINPTIDKIRQGLGNTGSNTKISNCLDRWRSERDYQWRTGQADLDEADLGSLSTKSVLEKLRQDQILEFKKMRQKYQSEIEGLKSVNHQIKEMLAKALNQVEELNFEKAAFRSEFEEMNSCWKQDKETRLLAEGELRGCQDALKRQEKSSDEFRQAYENGLSEIKACHQSELSNLKEGLRIAKDSMEDYRTRYIVDVDNLKIKNEQLQKRVFELVLMRKDSESLSQRLKLELKKKTDDISYLMGEKRIMESSKIIP